MSYMTDIDDELVAKQPNNWVNLQSLCVTL